MIYTLCSASTPIVKPCHVRQHIFDILDKILLFHMYLLECSLCRCIMSYLIGTSQSEKHQVITGGIEENLVCSIEVKCFKCRSSQREYMTIENLIRQLHNQPCCIVHTGGQKGLKKQDCQNTGLASFCKQLAFIGHEFDNVEWDLQQFEHLFARMEDEFSNVFLLGKRLVARLSVISRQKAAAITELGA